jgi:sec-independent protein translocase protein TatA
MGIGNIGWMQLLVILVIVLLIFGTKRIRNIGGDLGGAIREFRKGVGDNDDDDEQTGDGESKKTSSTDSEGQDESTAKRER